MKKRSVINYLAALICVAAIAYVFLWPHSLYDIAWLGVGRGEPETVRITADEVTDNPIRVAVTLPAFETAAFIDQMREASARFPIPSRQTNLTPYYFGIKLTNQHDVRAEIWTGRNGTINQEEPANRRWGNGTYLLYQKDAEEFFRICEEWISPDGKYPGMAFLREFFAVGKDGRSEAVFPDAPDGVYGGSAIETLYSGIKPYMTEHGFEKVLLGRSLYNLEYLCKQRGADWYCAVVEITPASDPGTYLYRVDLIEQASGNSGNYLFSGNYSVNEDGLVDQFYIDLKGAVWQEE